MRKLRRLFFSLLILGLLAVAALFTVNTIGFSSKQISVQPIGPIKVNDGALERLSEAVQIPTISYESGVDTSAFLRFDSFLVKNFPLVDSLLQKETAGAFNHVFKWQGRNTRLAPILLLAHTDVVPVESSSLGQWQQKPFSGAVKDGFVWGRGAMDDKASVCGILEAIEMLLETDYVPERTVYVALGHDEETGGANGAKRIAQKFKEQGLQFDFVIDEGLTVVEDAMPGLNKPLALIGVAEKGYVTLELSVSLKEGGHSSMPSPSSAINILSEAIVKLKNKPSPATIDGPVRSMFEHVGPEMSLFQKTVFANLKWTGGLIKRQMSKEPATNAMLRTTVAPTMLSGGFKENVLPSKVSAKVNCRILPGESVLSVMNYFKKTIDDERVSISLSKSSEASEPPAVSGAETFGYQVIQTSIRQVFPDALVSPGLMIGATDSRHYQSVSGNIYRFLPLRIKKEDLSRYHGLNERIGTETYRQVVRFYRQLILNGCK